MKYLNRILMMMAVIGLTGASAHAGWGILGGATLSHPSMNPSFNLSSKAAVTGGLAFESSIAPGLGLEADVLYQTQKVEALGVTQTRKGINVPVMLRFHLLPLVSLGVGGYFTNGIGDIDNNGTSGSYDASGMKKTDAGAIGSLRIAIPAGLASVVLDGRYQYGLSNQIKNTAGNASIKTRNIQVLAGLMFGI